jgi:hypothetical protein
MRQWVSRKWLVWIGMGVFLAACQGGDKTGAAGAIEQYLQARVKSDVNQMTLLSCPTWEAQARVEAVSFQSMNAQLEGVSCEAGAAGSNGTAVTCTGKIVTTYQGEAREWSVSDHPYLAVEQDGEWRMCGYGQ